MLSGRSTFAGRQADCQRKQGHQYQDLGRVHRRSPPHHNRTYRPRLLSRLFRRTAQKSPAAAGTTPSRSWKAPLPTDPHSDDVLSVAWSPNGKKLVSGSVDDTVKIWNASDTTAAVNTLWGHTNDVYSVAFNHNGTRIASGSFDNTVKIWHASTGALIRTIEDHTDKSEP